MGLEQNWNAGGQGSNFNWQLKMLQELGANNTLFTQILAVLGAAPGIDYELWTVTYKANKVGTGYSTNDIILRVSIINPLTATIVSTLWFNETAGFTIPAPPQVDIDVVTGSSTISISQATPGTTNKVAISTDAKGATIVGTPTSRSKSADVTALDVQIVDALGVPIVTFGSSSITSLIPGTTATSLGKAEDAGHTSGDTGVMMLAVRNDSQTALSGSDLDYTPIAVDTYGNVKISGDVADNAVLVNIKPILAGGKAVQTSTYAPAYTAGDSAALAIDKDNGGLLVNQANLSEATDIVASVYSEPTKTTYSAATLGLASAVTATDIFTIIGSASKTVKIKRIEITGFSTAGGAIDVQILKRSTADTTGTSTTLTNVPHDSNNAAATAVVKAYTANPGALGTLVGAVKQFKVVLPTAAGTVPMLPLTLKFGEDGEQSIVLRGVAENIAINLNGVTVAGSNFDINITWTEE